MFIRDKYLIIKSMERVGWDIQIEILTEVNGDKIKSMVTEFLL